MREAVKPSPLMRNRPVSNKTVPNQMCIQLREDFLISVVMAAPSFKTGTTIIISRLLENVPSNQRCPNVEFINPECLVTSTSRVAVGGMMSGTMITYWIIQLTYKISSDLQLMIKISKSVQNHIVSTISSKRVLYFLLIFLF